MKKKDFKPQNKEELLAYDLAESLKDFDHLHIYLDLCKQYTQNSLLKILGEVKEIPEAKIRKSKGALFTYLVRRYGKKPK
ncbi:MAG: hypothetical protein ABII25_04715 [bacterium]